MIFLRPDGVVRRLTAAALCAGFLSIIAPLRAQTTAPTLSPVILGITQEAVVPGKMPAFLKTRAAATEALRPVAGGQIAVGLVSVSGPEEVWTFNFHQDLADIEATRLAVEKLPATRAALDRLDEQAGVCLSHRQTQTATYLPDLTYQPGFDWAQARYLDIIVVHVRAGHHLAYLGLRRMSRDGHNKGGLDGPLHVFKLNSGVRGLAWMIVRPLRSLQQYDELKAQGFGEILTPQEDARMEALRAESMEDAEERFFRVEPAISLVPTAWIARDPAFWAPVAR